MIWGVYPTLGNANADVVPGALVAYDATAVVNGKLKQLFHSDANPANSMGLREVRHTGRGERQSLRRDIQQEGRPGLVCSRMRVLMKNILTAGAIALAVCLAVASTHMTAAPQAQAQAAPDAPVPEG